MDKINLNLGDVETILRDICTGLIESQQLCRENKTLKVFGIPRGGIPVAYIIAGILNNARVTYNLDEADIIADDIVDTGKTRSRYLQKKPDALFISVINKASGDFPNNWIVFPWERANGADASAEDIPIRLLEYIGENPDRGGLLETPKRFIKAWEEYSSGYNIDPSSVLKTFEDGAETYDEMVVVPGIPFYSHCEHHLAPFFGSVTIGYIPNKKIVGLSKFSRLVDVFSKRLQVQERMTTQIAAALNNALSPIGVGVFVEARHLCMESRGISKSCHPTKTQALFGKFRNDEKVRNEFLSLCKK